MSEPGTFGVVIAFQMQADRDPDQLREECAIVIESQYDVDGQVSVAVSEVAQRAGKVTRGEWGGNGR